LEPYDITLPMWRVLAVLHRRGATRFGVLVTQTLIEPPTLARLIATLASKGLVTKTSSDVDARGVLIVPTKGLALVEQLTPHAFAVENETMAGIDGGRGRAVSPSGQACVRQSRAVRAGRRGKRLALLDSSELPAGTAFRLLVHWTTRHIA
jgi:DNA-binding MarR family transcriptional regulator